MPVVEANGTKTIVSLATQLIILYVAFYGFAIVVYGGAVKLIGKTSPVKFFKAIMPAALNAFGTCSSSATIPISKRCVEKELGVSNQISSIAIPLGATVNMDAVSILMSFMIMFFANACGISVSISMMVIILLANVLLSVGTPVSSAIDPCTEEFPRFKRSGMMAWCSKQIHSPCSAGLAYLFSVNAGSCCPLG